MEYRLILLKNGEYLHTIYTCSKLKTAYRVYHTKLVENDVIFPKKYVNCNGIEPVNYHLCLVKEYEDSDEPKYIIDEYGRNINLGKINDKWSLLSSEKYNVEEKFYIYTSDHEKIKEPISYVVKILAKHAYRKSAMKQVVLIYNKILIYDEEKTDVVVCKCREDAERLHYNLYLSSKRLKVGSLVFNGNPTKEIITMSYEKIMGHTNWPHHKVRKQSSYK